MKKLAIALGLLGGLMLAVPTSTPTYAQKSFFQDLGKLMPWNAGKGDIKKKPAKKKKAAKKPAAKKPAAKKPAMKDKKK